MTPKTEQLIQLVKDKTLLREAPLVRDLVLKLYRFDIDDPKNERKSTDVPGECPIYERMKIVRRFGALVREVRESALVVGEYPRYNFWIVEDENKKHRVVHIKKGLNQNYILKNLKRIEKLDAARERLETLIRLNQTSSKPPPSNREEAEWWAERSIERKKEYLMKNYCLRKHIKRHIKELKRSPWSPELEFEKEKWTQTHISSDFANTNANTKSKIQIERGTKYKPNFKGIQHVFIQNAIEMYLETDTLKGGPHYVKPRLQNMLKDIILCDYHGKNYNRIDRSEEKIKGGKEKLILDNMHFKSLRID